MLDMSSEFDWQLMIRFFSNVSLSKISKTSISHSFLFFLAIAQALRIEFLSIPWQSTRDEIEKIDISRIHETSANIRMSLVFKRVSNKKKINETEAKIFEMLSNEIIVLDHSSIQEHSNIAKLQSICWDIFFDDKVWLVLMSEKSQFDDLYSFATRSVEKELNIHHRLKLCVEIEEAIITCIHIVSNCDWASYNSIWFNVSINIIHEDVKSQNVLIFKDHDDTYSARITDFEYSTRYANDIDLIIMLRSWSWFASKHDRDSKI